MQEPTPIYHIIRGVVLLGVLLGLCVWGFIRQLKRSEDPPLLVFKWIVTAFALGMMIWMVDPFGNRPLIWTDVVVGLIGGAALAVTWRTSIGAMIAKPFASLYDGGDREIEPQAYYSQAEAKRARGYYTEAVAEIRKQLERFPTDIQGQFLLAQIQAENLNDLPGAEVTLQRFCNQAGHSPRNIAYAQNLLADLHLKYGKDPEAARQALEKVVAQFPNTDLAESARQRIAHLPDAARILEPHDRRATAVPEGVKSVGLMASSTHLAPVEADPEKSAAELVGHLVLHPHDSEAREKLAIIYTDHYQRPDLAADQLEQLIAVPGQTPKNIARWLNLLADLQVRGGADYAAVRKTLERIIELFPDHSSATLARNRIDKLKLEFKSRVEKQDVKLGTYEQNVGLRQGRPI